MSEARKQADLLRVEAKRLLRRLLGMQQEGIANDSNGLREGESDRLVDCIISAALLESAIPMSEWPRQ